MRRPWTVATLGMVLLLVGACDRQVSGVGEAAPAPDTGPVITQPSSGLSGTKAAASARGSASSTGAVAPTGDAAGSATRTTSPGPTSRSSTAVSGGPVDTATLPVPPTSGRAVAAMLAQRLPSSGRKNGPDGYTVTVTGTGWRAGNTQTYWRAGNTVSSTVLVVGDGAPGGWGSWDLKWDPKTGCQVAGAEVAAMLGLDSGDQIDRYTYQVPGAQDADPRASLSQRACHTRPLWDPTMIAALLDGSPGGAIAAPDQAEQHWKVQVDQAALAGFALLSDSVTARLTGRWVEADFVLRAGVPNRIVADLSSSLGKIHLFLAIPDNPTIYSW